MEVKAIARFQRVSPFKGRLVADLIRGRDVNEAMGILAFTPKKTAVLLKKLLSSAIANATARGGVNIDDLYVKRVMVDGGPTLKRIMTRSQGRINRILKRTAHFTIVLDERD
ncbi:MAG: 50S ribosomal protein L22 [Deltaproteobacteria bacterium]|nr:50S ribosomal protein L22 [Deltaproteobacteria bacterium]